MTNTYAYSPFRASRNEKKPWIVTKRDGKVVKHEYHATELQAREAIGLTGGSDSLGPPTAAAHFDAEERTTWPTERTP